MVTMPPPECAAAPLGSVILVHLPSTRGFLPFFCTFTLSQKLPTLLPLCFLGFACHGARRCRHDFQRRVSIQVCVCVNLTRKHWCFPLDLPTDSVIEGELARAPVPSSVSMWALWQHAGQLLNHTCLYPSSLHKYGGQRGAAATFVKCQRCCQLFWRDSS